jgi:hypothetical protein
MREFVFALVVVTIMACLAFGVLDLVHNRMIGFAINFALAAFNLSQAIKMGRSL